MLSVIFSRNIAQIMYNTFLHRLLRHVIKFVTSGVLIRKEEWGKQPESARALRTLLSANIRMPLSFDEGLTSQREGYNFLDGSKAVEYEKSGVHLMRLN